MNYAAPPTAQQLDALAVELGFPVAFVRRIEGGLGCTTDVLVGGDRELVLRRHGPWWKDRNDRVAIKEAALLRLLGDNGVPVATVLWAQHSGIFDGPALVTDYVEGEDLLIPADPDDAARRLAQVLVAIHSVEPDPDTRALLSMPTSPDGERHPTFFDHPAAMAVVERLEALRPEPASAVIHGDFWPGNTLWRDGRLAAVVDWEEATLGDPMNDVAYCAVDLRYLGLDEAAEVFVHTYSSSSGRSLAGLEYWTLFALSRPMPDIARWLPAWETKGITHLSAADLRATHQRLLEEALR